MNIYILYRKQFIIIFILVFCIVLAGSFFKVMHYPYAYPLLILGLILLLPLALLTLYDMATNPIRLKALWIILMLLSPLLVGLIYAYKRDDLIESKPER
jgi:hypothetical protein